MLQFFQTRIDYYYSSDLITKGRKREKKEKEREEGKKEGRGHGKGIQKIERN